MVARGVERAREARALLGAALGSVILEPLASGQIDGRSYVVLPFCRPLNRSRLLWPAQRRRLVPAVLRWLHAAAEVSSRADGSDFATPLRRVIDDARLPDAARRAAEAALARLDAARWQPRHALDHNDLWKANLMLPPRATLGHNPVYPFTIIDWVGANTRGHGVYDLIRLAYSMELPPARLRLEIGRHTAALGVEPCDAWGHLLAALGWLGMHLEDFPVDRYVHLVERCCQTLRAADAAGAADARH